jgi:hypothetical protein
MYQSCLVSRAAYGAASLSLQAGLRFQSHPSSRVGHHRVCDPGGKAALNIQF